MRADKDEVVDKSGFSSDKNDFPLAMESSPKTFRTSITSQQSRPLKRRLITRYNSFGIFDCNTGINKGPYISNFTSKFSKLRIWLSILS